MVKNPVTDKKPIIWGAVTGHIGKLVWRASALTHVVGFLYQKVSMWLTR